MFTHLLRAVPTALIVLGLIAVGALGHYYGWRVPKFSALVGNGQVEEADWCSAHSVPESVCVECNPALYPKPASFGWCAEHGVHECPFEHPQVAQLASTPLVSETDLQRARRALDLKERPANNPRGKKHERRLQLTSREALDKLGVEVEPAWQGPVVEAVQASAEVCYDQPRVAAVAPLIAGRVVHLSPKARLGAAVRAGDVLGLVEALEVGKAKTDFMQALVQQELKDKALAALRTLGLDPGDMRLREADAAVREAQLHLVAAQQVLINLGLPVDAAKVQGLSAEELGRRLQFLGLPEEIVVGLDPRTTSANLLPVRAPRDGVVTTVKASLGEMADPAKPLVVVADTRQMGLILHVRLEDVQYLRARDEATGAPGQQVRFRSDAGSPELAGELAWISTEADEKTRTVQARAIVPNPKGQLRAHAFGQGRIVLREEKDAVLVRSEAVHHDGDSSIVFVQDKNFHAPGSPKIFHVRTVRLGAQQGGNTEIIAGLLPGEVVAWRNSGILRGELLKGQLGEDCCGQHHHHP